MRRFSNKRPRLVALSVVAVLVMTGAAFAYFTSTGSGSGSTTVGTSSAVVIHGTIPSTLYPGALSAVTFTVDNPSSGHQQVGTIHLASINACPSGDSWNGTACSNGGIEITSCESGETGGSDTNTANFWMPDVVSNQDFPTGNGQSITASGALTMNDLNSSQNSCKNANLTLNFTS
jgi:hypothetical protein